MKLRNPEDLAADLCKISLILAHLARDESARALSVKGQAQPHGWDVVAGMLGPTRAWLSEIWP